MKNFRRDIYKLTKSPKPTKPDIQEAWYVSEAKRTADFSDYCIPITEQVYKVPNSSPVQPGDFVYKDFQETDPLTPTMTDVGTYTIANQTYPSGPSGTSNIEAITVDNTGLVTGVTQGDCNPSILLQTIYVTKAFVKPGMPCGIVVSYPVKIESNNVVGGEVQSLSQLYTNSSSNSNPIPLDPTTEIPDFNPTYEKYIGLGVVSGNPSTQSMELGSNGVVFNSVIC